MGEQDVSYLCLWPGGPGHVVAIRQTALPDEFSGGTEKCTKPPMLLEFCAHELYIIAALFIIPVHSSPRRGVHLGLVTASQSMESVQVS